MRGENPLRQRLAPLRSQEPPARPAGALSVTLPACLRCAQRFGCLPAHGPVSAIARCPCAPGVGNERLAAPTLRPHYRDTARRARQPRQRRREADARPAARIEHLGRRRWLPWANSFAARTVAAGHGHRRLQPQSDGAGLSRPVDSAASPAASARPDDRDARQRLARAVMKTHPRAVPQRRRPTPERLPRRRRRSCCRSDPRSRTWPRSMSLTSTPPRFTAIRSPASTPSLAAHRAPAGRAA